MPLSSSSSSLGSIEIVDKNLAASVQQKLNDRLRRIAQAIAASGTTTGLPGSSGGSGAGELILTVPGILAVESDAAPAVTLGGSTLFTSAVLLVKQAPTPTGINVQIFVDGASWGPVLSIAANKLSSVTQLSAPAIAADQLIRVDITQVGASLGGVTFPGSDLSVILR